MGACCSFNSSICLWRSPITVSLSSQSLIFVFNCSSAFCAVSLAACISAFDSCLIFSISALALLSFTFAASTVLAAVSICFLKLTICVSKFSFLVLKSSFNLLFRTSILSLSSFIFLLSLLEVSILSFNLCISVSKFVICSSICDELSSIFSSLFSPSNRVMFFSNSSIFNSLRVNFFCNSFSDSCNFFISLSFSVILLLRSSSISLKSCVSFCNLSILPS